jgi:hypothetical protein
MEALAHLLPKEQAQAQVPYIKANIIVNKATSSYFGFPKMLKKNLMSKEMLEIRKRVLDDYIKLFEVLEDSTMVKETIYRKWQQPLIEEKQDD